MSGARFDLQRGGHSYERLDVRVKYRASGARVENGGDDAIKAQFIWIIGMARLRMEKAA